MRSRYVMAVVLGCMVFSPLVAQELPNTKELGRAAVEYRDDAVHLVAAYYYSQLNHETRWLLIETALTTEARTTIPREAFRLMTPTGVEIALASQERFFRETEQTRLLLQNAALVRHNVRSYFNRRPRVEPLRFFSLPPGPLVQSDVRVDRFRVVTGDLFFEARTGTWEQGVYTLVLDHEGTHAAVPIDLR